MSDRRQRLEDDMENLAAAVVQVYKTLNDCLTGGYRGSVMFKLLARSVKAQTDKAELPSLPRFLSSFSPE